MGPLDPPTQSDCDALANLPSLTRLQLHFLKLTGPAHIDFVRSLPLLQQLHLRFPSAEMLPLWPRIGEALAHCAHLRELSLSNPLLTTEQLHECLAQMPLLADLSLDSWRCSLPIRSLSFLRAGRLSLSLEALSLRADGEEWQLRLPFSELLHVESLQALRICRLQGVLASPFTAEQELVFDEHCERDTWPLLEHFHIENMTIE